jgi:hypothetical protein
MTRTSFRSGVDQTAVRTMTNPSKAKGTAFETAVVRFLQGRWPGVERRALAGNKDKGDIQGIPGWVLECKAVQNITLASFVDEALVEAKNAGVPYGAAVIKRRGKGIGQAYVVMTLEQWVESQW